MEKLLTLGIDPMAIVVYLANTGLIILILAKLLYKPVLKILDKRRDIIQNSLDEAKNMQQSFESKITQLEKEKHETEAKLEQQVEKMHKFAEEKRAELIEEMEEARAGMLKKTQTEIDARKQELIKDVEKEVKTLMARIILEVVENKVPEEIIQESIGSAWKQHQK